jgi:hypothetical protein
MKHRVIEYITAWLLLVILAFIVVHAPLTVFVGTRVPALAEIIKSWKEWLLLLALVGVLIETTRLKQWPLFTRDAVCWLALGYAALHIGALAWTHTTAAAVVAGLAIDLRYILYFVLVYMFVRLHPAYRRSFGKIALVGAGIVLGFAALQLVLPHDALKYLGYSYDTIAPYMTVDKNPDYIRINSTLRGPNPLGAYAVGALAGAAAYIASRRINWQRGKERFAVGAFAVAAIVALWNSYSRSALVAGLIAVGLVFVVRYGKRPSKRVWYALAVGTLVLAVLGAAVRDTSFVHNVILHDNPATGANVDSNAGHLASVQHGVERMLSEPMGLGVGTTGSASLLGSQPTIIENQYLMIAHEVGWAGLALFMALYTVIIQRLWRLRSTWYGLAAWASGIGLALIGILLPVWADDTVSIVWWGLAGMILAKGAGHGTTTNKKAA